MKFNYGKIFLLGFGFFGVSVIWSVYNAFVPLFLANKFGLTPALIGFFMTLDNIAALFIQPPVGAWSDRLRTPIGRRIPFILIGAPVGALAFGLIPLAAVLPLFVACTSTLLLSMAFWRTPVVALMPDITPSQYRSQANGVINLMGGIGTIIASLVGSTLYEININFPFWMGSGLVILAAVMVFIFIREPKDYETLQNEQVSENSLTGFFEFLRTNVTASAIASLIVVTLGVVLAIFLPEISTLGNQLGFPPYIGLGIILIFVLLIFFYAFYMAREVIFDQDKNGLRILLAIFFWFLAYNGIETFLTLYATKRLGLPEGDAGRLFGHLGLMFVLFALVAGIVGSRIGRRVTISLGITLMAALILGMLLLPVEFLAGILTKAPVLGNIRGISLLLMPAGIAWAFININSLPMVVDLTTSARIGTFTGLYYLFSTLAAIVGPNLNGILIQVSGNNYNAIMVVSPAFLVIALLLMLGVKRGEASLEASQ